MLSLSRAVRLLNGFEFGFDFIRFPDSIGEAGVHLYRDELQDWANAINSPLTIRWGLHSYTLTPSSTTMQEFQALTEFPDIYFRAIGGNLRSLKLLEKLCRSPQAAGISTYSHRQLAVNSKAAALFNDRPEILIDLDVSKLWHPQDRDDFDRAVRSGTIPIFNGWGEYTYRTRIASAPEKIFRLTNRYFFDAELGLRLGSNLESIELFGQV